VVIELVDFLRQAAAAVWGFLADHDMAVLVIGLVAGGFWVISKIWGDPEEFLRRVL
jgi:hypothetical protein